MSSIYLLNIAKRLDLPYNTIKRASELLELSYDKMRGSHIEDIVLACVYRAILEDNLPISFKEVELLSNDKRRFRRRYRELINRLGLEHITFNYDLYLNKVINRLGLDINIFNTAKKNMDKYKEHSIGKNPRVFIAGILYKTLKDMNYNIKQKDIADACNVTEVSVRNMLNKL